MVHTKKNSWYNEKINRCYTEKINTFCSWYTKKSTAGTLKKLIVGTLKKLIVGTLKKLIVGKGIVWMLYVHIVIFWNQSKLKLKLKVLFRVDSYIIYTQIKKLSTPWYIKT